MTPRERLADRPTLTGRTQTRVSTATHGRTRARKVRETLRIYALLSPALAVIAAFSFIPLVWNFMFSLTSGGMLGEREFVGLSNYLLAVQNPVFRRTLVNTLEYAVLAVPSAVIFAMVVAIVIFQLPRMQGFFRGAVYFPVIVPAVVAASVWAYVLNRDFGPLNYFLGIFGVPKIDWLGNPDLAIPAIVMMEVWRGFGFYVIVFSAALLAIPSDIYDAARIDGATGLRLVTSMTIPLLRPALAFAFVVATIWNLQIFEAVYVLTRGGPAGATSTVSWYVYQQAFQANDIGLASTMSNLLLVLILGLALVQLRYFRSDVEY
jgi:multiple sugar transport system permease protein